MSEELSGVYAKMHAVQAAIKDIPKTGKNSKQNYAFRTIDDVLAEFKAQFDRIGLVCFPCRQEVKDYKVSDDEKKVRVLLEVTYQLTDIDDGSYCYLTAVGEGVDFGGDKATYKAMTGAQKYALTQAFTMPCDGYDPERTDFEAPKAKGR